MNAVRPDLYVGKLADTLNHPLLQAEHIGAVLQLARAYEPPGLTTLYLPVEDGEPLDFELLRRGVAFVDQQRNAGRRVLIACGAGISRSAAFAVAVVKEAETLTLLEAYAHVVQARPQALPHPLLWQSLCGYYNESVSVAEMIKQRRPVPTPW